MWATSAIMSLHLRLALFTPAHYLPESVAQLLAESVAHFDRNTQSDSLIDHLGRRTLRF